MWWFEILREEHVGNNCLAAELRCGALPRAGGGPVALRAAELLGCFGDQALPSCSGFVSGSLSCRHCDPRSCCVFSPHLEPGKHCAHDRSPLRGPSDVTLVFLWTSDSHHQVLALFSKWEKWERKKILLENYIKVRGRITSFGYWFLVFEKEK